MLYMDYHVHCQNSPDSSEPLEEICKGAMDAGIKEIMITDHYEMFTDDFGRKAYQPEYHPNMTCLTDITISPTKYGFENSLSLLRF